MTRVKFDAQGLVPAVAQDRATGEVRMVAYMNAEALARTQETGYATFFSRSRQKLWVKGASSGHRLKVHRVVADCDQDTLLLLVDPEGPSCHTGKPSCFFEDLSLADASAPPESDRALPYLFELESVIEKRQHASADKSYTRSLFDGGAERVGEKLAEEAAELADAVRDESVERVRNEAADLFYHALVALRLRGVPLRDVVATLAGRAARSGLAEKAARTPPGV